MLRNLSALGDTALLAPASLALLLYLVAIRRWIEARAFVAALTIGLGATLLSKLLFRACGVVIDVMDLNSPSGHASFATLFYGSLVLLLGRGRPRPAAVALGIVAAVLLLAIGASRPLQGAHSWEEVFVGWLIGAAGLTTFVAIHRRSAAPPLSPLPLAAGLALAILVLGGRHFTPEYYIARVARAASAKLDICRETPVTWVQPRLVTLHP